MSVFVPIESVVNAPLSRLHNATALPSREKSFPGSGGSVVVVVVGPGGNVVVVVVGPGGSVVVVVVGPGGSVVVVVVGPGGSVVVVVGVKTSA